MIKLLSSIIIILVKANYDFREIDIDNIAESTVSQDEIGMKQVKTEEIKMEPIDLNVVSTHYVSDAMKDRENFEKYYDNNYMYITFREKYIAKNTEEVEGDMLMIRDLFEKVVV